MAHMTELPPAAPPRRSDKPGHVGLLLFLAALLVGAAIGLSVVTHDKAQPLILGLLAILAMAGVFFVFALAIGAIQFGGEGARNDLTKAVADTAREGLAVVEDDGRIVYANDAYLSLAGAGSLSDLRAVERAFTGAPDVSEAIYRLAQAAREGRPAGEEIRMAPALDGTRDFAWYRVSVRPVPRAARRFATLWSVADVTQDREKQESVFQELQHAIDYLDHAPAGFFSVAPDGPVVYMNATLAAWLDYDLAQVGSGGLALRNLVSDNVVAMMTSVSGTPGGVRTETFDLDLRRRGGQALPVRIYHRLAFDADGRPGASRSLVLNRSPGEDVDEGAARRRGPLRALLQQHADRHRHDRPRRQRRAPQRLVRAPVRHPAGRRRRRAGPLGGRSSSPRATAPTSPAPSPRRRTGAATSRRSISASPGKAAARCASG